ATNNPLSAINKGIASSSNAVSTQGGMSANNVRTPNQSWLAATRRLCGVERARQRARSAPQSLRVAANPSLPTWLDVFLEPSKYLFVPEFTVRRLEYPVALVREVDQL